MTGDEDERLLGWTGMDGGRRHKEGDARRHVTVRPVNVSCIPHHKKYQLQWQWNLEGVGGHCTFCCFFGKPKTALKK